MAILTALLIFISPPIKIILKYEKSMNNEKVMRQGIVGGFVAGCRRSGRPPAFAIHRRLCQTPSPYAPTPWLEHALAEGAPLAMALNTEKARSEFLIAPVLLEVHRLFPGQASLFSDLLFDVDPARGLTRYEDFLLESNLHTLDTAYGCCR
jgi:hypothetical protein